MTSCPSCGTPNTEGARFCVKCGTTLSSAPAPESWRAPSGDLNQTVVDQNEPSTGGYTPPSAGPSSYPTYTPPQDLAHSQSYGQTQARAPIHPAIPAIVSLFFPGMGLLFVPNKAGLGILIFAVVVVWNIFVIIMMAFLVGLCLLPISLIVAILAAVHSYDSAAKVSNGEFKPLLFK